MAFLDCINSALTSKRITGKKAEEVRERYTNLFNEEIGKGAAIADAELTATKGAISKAEAEVKYRVRGRIKDAELAMRIDAELKAAPTSPGVAAQAFIQSDARIQHGNYAARVDKYRGMFHGMMDEMIDKYQPQFAGLYRPVQGLENIIHELFGRDTKDASSAAIAKAWTGATDLGVELHNHHGGAVMNRGDWRLPQKQNSVKLAKMGQAEWVSDHMAWMDWSKVRRSDGTLVAVADRETVLKGVFDTIKTDGHIKPPGERGGSNSANQLDAHRFLSYKDSDAWLAMHAKYGDGNVMEVMMSHLNDKAHELAVLETFGRNPQDTADLIRQLAQNLAATKDAAQTGPMKKATLPGVQDDLKVFDDMFGLINREVTMGQENKLAHIGSGLRNIITSNVLASASLAAIPGDMMTAALARHYSGLPWVRGMGLYIGALNPLNHEVQIMARRAGFVDDAATSLAYASERFSGINTYGPSITKRMSDTVLRLSLMTPHTQAARWSHQLEMLGYFHDVKAVPFDDLALKGTFEKYGITRADWDTFRAMPSWQPKPGVEFMRPADILNSGKLTDAKTLLHDKLMTMVVDEGKLAIPDATIRAKVALTGNTRPGTMIGELAASGAMFKNFPVTVGYMYGREMLAKEGLKGKASYAAAFTVAMSMVGALSVQMGELANGRDPIDMKRGDFWGRAMLKGGSLGYLGDFVFNDLNAYARGLGATAAGPVLGLATDVKNLTLGNAQQIFQGKPTNFTGEAFNVATHLVPGTSLWYAKLAMKRLVTEQIQRLADPKASSKLQRQETNQLKTSGNSSWWAPGNTSPSRGPLLSGQQ